MSTALKIHVAEVAPSHCAACFQQKPQATHVDFGASYDGPILPSGEESTGVNGVAIDDLIICEECLSAAAAQIGLGDVSKVEAKLSDAIARTEELSERLAGAVTLITQMEAKDKSRASLQESLKPTKSRAKA